TVILRSSPIRNASTFAATPTAIWPLASAFTPAPEILWREWRLRSQSESWSRGLAQSSAPASPHEGAAPASGDFCITPSRSDSRDRFVSFAGPVNGGRSGYLLTNEHAGSGGPNASSPLICVRTL